MRKFSPLLSVLVCLTLVLAACGDSGEGTTSTAAPPASTPPTPSLDGTSWVLTGGTLDGAPIQPLRTQPPTLAVAGEQATGTTGCNMYDASLVLTPSGELSIAVIAVTEIGCDPSVMETEARFLAALGRVDRFEWDANRLNLSNGSASLDFVAGVPADNPPLGSTEWVLTGFVDDDVASSVVANTRLTLLVNVAGGAMRGSGGCNTFGGGVDLDGERFVVSEMAYTEIGCEEPIMSQEVKYFGTLADAATWHIEGGILTIATADGRALTFAAGG